MTRTCLYRYFNKDKALLYVGITDSPVTRFGQHKVSSPWLSEVEFLTADWLESREHAAALERVAIRFEHPLHNKNGALPQPRNPDGADQLLTEILNFIATNAMTKTEFGKRALGDFNLVDNLLAGREMRRKTADRVRAFMAEAA